MITTATVSLKSVDVRLEDLHLAQAEKTFQDVGEAPRCLHIIPRLELLESALGLKPTQKVSTTSAAGTANLQ